MAKISYTESQLTINVFSHDTSNNNIPYPVWIHISLSLFVFDLRYPRIYICSGSCLPT